MPSRPPSPLPLTVTVANDFICALVVAVPGNVRTVPPRSTTYQLAASPGAWSRYIGALNVNPAHCRSSLTPVSITGRGLARQVGLAGRSSSPNAEVVGP